MQVAFHHRRHWVALLLMLGCPAQRTEVASGSPGGSTSELGRPTLQEGGVVATPSAPSVVGAPPRQSVRTPASASPGTALVSAPDVEVDVAAVDTSGWKLKAVGFPALSKDTGRVLAYVMTDPNYRGVPNDLFTITSVKDDKVQAKFSVFKGEELGGKGDATMEKAIRTRLEQLKQVVAKESWMPMPAASRSKDNQFTLGEYSFELKGTLATLTKGEKVVATYKVPHWKAKDIEPDEMSAFPCRYAASLEAVHMAPEAKVVAATVRQKLLEGTVCGIDASVHVLRWQ